jgi:hypothetical protein
VLIRKLSLFRFNSIHCSGRIWVLLFFRRETITSRSRKHRVAVGERATLGLWALECNADRRKKNEANVELPLVELDPRQRDFDIF